MSIFIKVIFIEIHIHLLLNLIFCILNNILVINPCNPNQCGVNTVCKVIKGEYYKCDCLKDYLGSPQTHCAEPLPELNGCSGKHVHKLLVNY